MNSAAKEPLQIGSYSFEHSSGTLEGGGLCERVEPKVADLLALLAERPGEIMSREQISAALWPDVVVGEDALPRCVSKLRRALGDEAKNPRYVETVPKRGYRLVAAVGSGQAPEAGPGPSEEPLQPPIEAPAPASVGQSGAHRAPANGTFLLVAVLSSLVVAAWLWRSSGSSADADRVDVVEPPGRAERLVDRADDFYIHITRSGNESAIELYEQALAVEPEYARAHAGLANALVQRVLRYPASEIAELETVNLGSALAAGRLQTPEAKHHLERALGLAERAVRLEPESAAALKALGFVTSALGRLDEADAIYVRALELDPDAWDVLINLGDVHEIRGQDQQALHYFRLAHGAMERVYGSEPQRVGPWLAELGAAIGERYAAADQAGEAEIWFRRVLASSPLHPAATCSLADLLRSSGDAAAARRMETELAERLGEAEVCARGEIPDDP